MARPFVPKEAATGIQPLLEVNSDQFAALMEQLTQQLPVSLSVADELAKIVGDFQGLSDNIDKAKLVEAMIGIHYLRLSSSSEEELIAAISQTWLNYRADGASTLSNLIQSIKKLLQIKSLQASLKAITLMGDHGRVMNGIKIFTDMRPVFGENLSSDLLASIISHTIKINTLVDGKSELLYIAADSDDLKRLRDSIDRALAKANLLDLKIRASGNLGAALDYPTQNKSDS